MKNMEAGTVAEILLWSSSAGWSSNDHSLLGRNFESKLFKQVCHQLGMKKTRTTGHHPSGNGLVERTEQDTEHDVVPQHKRIHSLGTRVAFVHGL